MATFNPRCKDNKKLAYISSSGYMKPCCWRDPISDHFNSPEYDLNKISLEQAANNINVWLQAEIEKPLDQLDKCCLRHCVHNIIPESVM